MPSTFSQRFLVFIYFRDPQAEFAEWFPADSKCLGASLKDEMSTAEICHVLKGATLYFIGDSYVRHVYTALLLRLTENEESGAIMPETPTGKGVLTSLYNYNAYSKINDH